MPELNTYLEDVSFDFEESEDSLGAHIALTFDFHGGAASGYNKPLLFKAVLYDGKSIVIFIFAICKIIRRPE